MGLLSTSDSNMCHPRFIDQYYHWVKTLFDIFFLFIVPIQKIFEKSLLRYFLNLEEEIFL